MKTVQEIKTLASQASFFVLPSGTRLRMRYCNAEMFSAYEEGTNVKHWIRYEAVDLNDGETDFLALTSLKHPQTTRSIS
jgi:hypothetical protein